jgi:hypothetical protein
MAMSACVRQSAKLTQSLKLSREAKTQVLSHLLSIRLALIRAIREEDYRPKADCPSCGRKLTPLEIIQGFRADPNDYTTWCSGCGARFEPSLVAGDADSSVTIPFFCADQTLAQLEEIDPNTHPDELRKSNPGVFHSAVFHHGGVRRAFHKIGRDYEFDDVPAWREKVEPFLGRLQDGVIAEFVGVGTRAIRSLRVKLGISGYSVRKTLEELEAQTA